MKIMIAGATGYLGSKLCKQFAQEGCEIVAGIRTASNIKPLSLSLNRICDSINIEQELETVAEELRVRCVDVVIQCICDYGRFAPGLMPVVQANLMVPMKLLQAADMANVPSFINMGTSLPEEVNSYSRAKQQFVDWLDFESRIGQRLNLALEQFYGPGESSQQFIAWLIQRFTGVADVVELTAGDQKRDFIYIDDLVSAITSIVGNLSSFRNGFHNVAVGSGHAYRIRDIVELVQRECHAEDVPVRFGAKPYRPNEVMYSIADTRVLRQFGWLPKTDLQSGVRNCIEVVRSKQRIAA